LAGTVVLIGTRQNGSGSQATEPDDAQ